METTGSNETGSSPTPFDIGLLHLTCPVSPRVLVFKRLSDLVAPASLGHSTPSVFFDGDLRRSPHRFLRGPANPEIACGRVKKRARLTHKEYSLQRGNALSDEESLAAEPVFSMRGTRAEWSKIPVDAPGRRGYRTRLYFGPGRLRSGMCDSNARSCGLGRVSERQVAVPGSLNRIK